MARKDRKSSWCTYPSSPIELYSHGVPLQEIARRLDIPLGRSPGGTRAASGLRGFIADHELSLSTEEFKRLRLNIAGGRMVPVNLQTTSDSPGRPRIRLDPHSIWESRSEVERAAAELERQGFRVEIRARSLRRGGSAAEFRHFGRGRPWVGVGHSTNAAALPRGARRWPERPHDVAFGLYVSRES